MTDKIFVKKEVGEHVLTILAVDRRRWRCGTVSEHMQRDITRCEERDAFLRLDAEAGALPDQVSRKLAWLLYRYNAAWVSCCPTVALHVPNLSEVAADT